MLSPSINTAGVVQYLGQTLLAAPAAAITISNLPYYPRYIVVAKLRVDDAADQDISITFNGDAVGANYTRMGSSGETADASTLGKCARNDCAAGRFSIHEGQIEQSDTTHMKTYVGTGMAGGIPGSFTLSVRAVLWENVADAISSITYTPAAGNLIAGCSIRVYGVR